MAEAGAEWVHVLLRRHGAELAAAAGFFILFFVLKNGHITIDLNRTGLETGGDIGFCSSEGKLQQ